MTLSSTPWLARIASLILSPATLLTSHAAETGKATAPIKVLTYNILAGHPEWEKNAKCDVWAKRAPLVGDVMIGKDQGGPYDFIGTQETSTNSNPDLNQAKQLATRFKEYGSLYPPVDGPGFDGKFSLTNMIFWRKDRWEIDPQDSGAFWLSDTPETAGSNTWSPVDPATGKNTNKGGKRNVTYGLFHEIADGRRTGKKVYLFNTHLNVFVPEARMKSALLIMDRITHRKEAGAPVIVTGDFNARRDSNVYQFLTGSPVDFEGKSHTAPQPLAEAYAAVGKPEQLPRIDFIFTTPTLKPQWAADVNVDRDDLRGSDHAPIAARFEWK
jgi:endonuclease/exonuclease/phosphatase family metal-dependent hydrolase